MKGVTRVNSPILEMLVVLENHSTYKGEEHVWVLPQAPTQKLIKTCTQNIRVGRDPSGYPMCQHIGIIFPSPWLSPSLALFSLSENSFRGRQKYHLLHEAYSEIPGRMNYFHFYLTSWFLHTSNKAWMRLYYKYSFNSLSLPSFPSPSPSISTPPHFILEFALL